MLTKKPMKPVWISPHHAQTLVPSWMTSLSVTPHTSITVMLSVWPSYAAVYTV